MDVEETEVLLNPNERIIKQITVDDIREANELFEDLMGTEVEPRKKFIIEHSQEARQYGL